MALGKPVRKDLKAFSLKIKTKDLPAPVFVVSERQGDKFVQLDQTETNVTGTLVAIEPKEFVWEGKTIKSVSATLTDGDQIYFVTIPYSNLGRGLMNSLLSLKEFTDVEIGLYQTRAKVTGGKTYPATSLRQGGEIVRWRFEQKDLPQPDVTTFKGETLRDYTKVETFLAAQLTELNKLVKEKAPAQTAVASAAPVAAPAAEENDNVPF